MIFYLSFTRTWVCKFNSLSSQEYCKNDLVSEYIYISIYIYIFLNGILTFVHSCFNFFEKYIFDILTIISWKIAQNSFNFDIIYPIFDSEENGLLLVPITVTQMAQKMVQSGQPPPKMVQNHVFINKTKTKRVRDTNVWQLLKHFV